jgi:uncharacterized damage-inducible protein DinB
MSAEVKTAFEGVSANILKAADKMPDADFAFKPTPDVRSFGQLIAHVADAHTGICGIVKGDPKRGDAASKTSKADLIAALKASNDLCEAVYASMTDADGAATVKAPGGTRSKIGVLNFNVAHDNEMYGTMSVYLRLKGIVPPSTEAASAARGK